MNSARFAHRARPQQRGCQPLSRVPLRAWSPTRDSTLRAARPPAQGTSNPSSCVDVRRNLSGQSVARRRALRAISVARPCCRDAGARGAGVGVSARELERDRCGDRAGANGRARIEPLLAATAWHPTTLCADDDWYRPRSPAPGGMVSAHSAKSFSSPRFANDATCRSAERGRTGVGADAVARRHRARGNCEPPAGRACVELSSFLT